MLAFGGFLLARRTVIYIVLTIPKASAPVTASASDGFFLKGRAAKVRQSALLKQGCIVILPYLREIDTYGICHAAALRLLSASGVANENCRDTAHCSRSGVSAPGGFFVVLPCSRELDTYS
ncbi:hypothetical protein C8R43DRAFT_995834, partial [Mycena crocata]